jgi:D-mannonate dehydratase
VGSPSGGFVNTIYGRPGRDEEIENVCKSIRVSGRLGLPVIEYNFYAHVIPCQQYTEVFPDEGEVNMLAVMKELVRQKYARLVFPEHPRILDADRESPKSGSYASWAYNVGYARAALQAALSA